MIPDPAYIVHAFVMEQTQKMCGRDIASVYLRETIFFFFAPSSLHIPRLNIEQKDIYKRTSI